MPVEEMINHVENYLKENELHDSRIINYDWVIILKHCLALLKEEVKTRK